MKNGGTLSDPVVAVAGTCGAALSSKTKGLAAPIPVGVVLPAVLNAATCPTPVSVLVLTGQTPVIFWICHPRHEGRPVLVVAFVAEVQIPLDRLVVGVRVHLTNPCEPWRSHAASSARKALSKRARLM